LINREQYLFYKELQLDYNAKLKYELEKISDSCYLLHFLPKNDGGLLTSVFLIAGNDHLFVVDTAYGSDCMNIVKLLNETEFGNKFVIVFNTHSHWDHVWGNNVFKNNPRFAHYLCAERIKIHDEQSKIDCQSFIEGCVDTCLPDILFDSEIYFAEEGVKFFHSPGHTKDSCSVFYEKDSVLFVSDNLEVPLPYLENTNTTDFILSLEKYEQIKPSVIATAHSGVVPKDLLDSTLNYFKDFENAENWLEKDSLEWQMHQINKTKIGL
jgi:glyoxylase-like metal-dependent hydrolase (beta-lactamase superfamily II)